MALLGLMGVCQRSRGFEFPAHQPKLHLNVKQIFLKFDRDGQNANEPHFHLLAKTIFSLVNRWHLNREQN